MAHYDLVYKVDGNNPKKNSTCAFLATRFAFVDWEAESVFIDFHTGCSPEALQPSG